MRSGTKNVYLVIQRATQGRDPTTNAPVKTWSTWKTAWAAAQPRRGRETVVQDQIIAKTYQRFDFDYLDVAGIRETDRLVDENGSIWQIEGLLPDISTKDYFTVDASYQAIPTGN